MTDAYQREFQRVTVLQNGGNACIHCGGWGYTVPRSDDYAAAPCEPCKGTGEAIPKESALMMKRLAYVAGFYLLSLAPGLALTLLDHRRFTYYALCSVTGGFWYHLWRRSQEESDR